MLNFCLRKVYKVLVFRNIRINSFQSMYIMKIKYVSHKNAAFESLTFML